MQYLDIISINLWQILISLCNLLILYLLLKKFLYQPVKKVLAARQKVLDEAYSRAESAEKEAQEDRLHWEEKMRLADDEANAIVEAANSRARKRSDTIEKEAREKAGGILRDAAFQADLEYKKAQDKIKKEIVDTSALLAEKMLEREIRTEDHHDLIQAVLDQLGEEDDTAG